MKTMYSAQANSPGTELAEAITAQQTTIKVVDPSAVLDGPNLLTIGTDESSETILYTKKNGTVLTGVTRGYQGKAQSWGAGIKVARYVTAYDHDTFKENIEDLYKQIDATNLSTTLGPGTSVINADQASAAELTIYGQSRVNITGNYGNFEVDSNNDGVADGFSKAPGTGRGVYSLETTGAKYGLKAQRITSTSSDTTEYRYVNMTVPAQGGKRYVAIVDSATDGIGRGWLRVYKGSVGSDSNLVGQTAITSANTVLFYKFIAPSDTTELNLILNNVCVPPQIGWVQFDGAGIYEVSEDLYNRIGVDINETNIRDYLPHVDGVQHVNGVCITHPSKNLLPSQPDSLHANAKVIGLYDLELNAKGYNDASYFTVSVMPNTTMNLKVMHNGKIVVATEDRSSNLVAHTSNQEVKFNTGLNRAVTVAFTNYAPSGSLPAGTYNFKNWQLELGDKATDFEPARPQRLIIPETLAEVPGSRDEVQLGLQGATLVHRVVRNFMLDGSLTWGANQNYEGYKRVITTLSAGSVDSERVIKYTGQLLQHTELPGVQWTGPDMSRLADYNNIRALGITISNSESGWTLSGSPSEKAVKALMNGWKANGTNGTVYNSWVSIIDGKAPTTNTEAYVSANKAPGWTAWATVDCALDKPEIKPIKTEGAISLHSGGNQLTVSAGLVQREKAKLAYSTEEGGIYYLNGNLSNKLSRRAAAILGVYKDADNDDSSWAFLTRAQNHAQVPVVGMGYAKAKAQNVDPNADYYVTYIALDKYNYTANVTQLDVSYKAGISATLSDAVGNIAELKTQNDRQDFADTYIQANVENNRKDIDALSDRLNTASTSQVTLQPGLQTVKAARDARFNLGSVRGKTEINGSGRIGIVGVENPYIFRRASKSADAEILSMLAFQTELHANPNNGTDPDELYEKNGQYFRRAKWNKILLDGSLSYSSGIKDATWKQVYIDIPQGVIGSEIVIKFNGSKLTSNQGMNGPDQSAIDSGGKTRLYINIANADSGWGPDYNPTQDEIKAYFNGWRMCDGNTSQLYTGAAGEVKCWGAIAHPSNVIGSNGWFDFVIHDVPTYKAPVTGGYEYHPYNLLYRLAAEAIEPVAHEGCLTLSEGDNAIEVGTGIVLRERANPVYINHATRGETYFINGATIPAYPLKYRTEKIKTIYRNGSEDAYWSIIPVPESSQGAFGKEQSYISAHDYDQSAAYSVTYLKLDKSPIVPITGTLAANEKAQLSDLTEGVAEALYGVSMLAMKKAEKDAPGWITPTLLNGWVAYSGNANEAPRYKKIGDLVYLIGIIKSGVVGSTVFVLPPGYRPSGTRNVSVVVHTGSEEVLGRARITSSGEVKVSGGSAYVYLDSVSFEV